MEVIKIPPALVLANIDEVEVKVRAATVVMGAEKLSTEVTPAMAFPSYSIKELRKLQNDDVHVAEVLKIITDSQTELRKLMNILCNISVLIDVRKRAL